MRDIRQLREELLAIPGARVDFRPDVPPRIPLTGTRPSDGLSLPVHGRRPHLTVGPPPESPEQARETKFIYDQIEREVAGRNSNRESPRGIDALAWYASFHNLQPEWGIYIPESSLWYVAERWFRPWRVNIEQRLGAAFRVLYEHEVFHFAADLNVAQWEVMVGHPCWAPYRESVRGRDGYCQLEEQLANAYMLRILEPGLTKSASTALRKAVRRHPPGYSDAPQILETNAFADSLAELCKRHVGFAALHKGINLASRNLPIELFFDVFSEISAADCPLTIIRDADRVGRSHLDVALFDRIPAIRESQGFLKQLSSVPKDITKRWERKKHQLAQAIPRFPEFERLRDMSPTTYSIRLGDNFRAHLRPEPSYQLWTAIAVGPHTKMGHG